MTRDGDSGGENADSDDDDDRVGRIFCVMRVFCLPEATGLTEQQNSGLYRIAQ